MKTENDSTRLEDAIQDTIVALRAAGVTSRRPLDDVEVAQRELELARKIPHDLRVLYSRFDGVPLQDLPITSQLIRVWPLSEVRVADSSESGECGDCLVFADFLLSSIEYGINFEKDYVVLLNGEDSQVVAENLGDFLRKCLSDDRSLYCEATSRQAG
jgi:hypothetical protein